ncbi:F-box domain, cyclin-like protein [Artemisia annua]|uniref:F-box domain, cyclin-like protein n=1 Tax=Artemisia annua TaxID=35608 RepID=A0A2U1NUH7_ARTAN|nr:F-box domain, cyclin-like protein [Artemisia annua]
MTTTLKVRKSFSVPYILRKAFTDALGDDDNDGLLDHKLFGIAVCAVLLESGFVDIDPALKLPKNNNVNVRGTFTTLFRTLIVEVYGSLSKETGAHSVLADKDKLPFLSVVWAKFGRQMVDEKEVFEFWRKIKDGLELTLLIDVCEITGSELPPCFIKLPTELKLKISELVSGVDIANIMRENPTYGDPFAAGRPFQQKKILMQFHMPYFGVGPSLEKVLLNSIRFRGIYTFPQAMLRG